MSLVSIVRSSFVRIAVVAVAAFGLVIADADARSGKGGSVGSRGSKTYTAPPSTATSPGAAPIQKSMTGPSAATAGAATAGAATAAAAQTAKGSMMRNLLLGGLIGAGLASVFGAGALANVLGFLLQGLLIAGVVMLVVMLVRRMMGGSAAPATATAMPTPRQNLQQPLQRAAAGTGAGLPALTLGDADFNTFQRLLSEIQGAYSANDINAMGDRVTPEMLSYFAGELDDNRRKGLRNEMGPVTLHQGDLSEAWREAGSEFATVAMRYSMTDALIDSSGNVVSGDRTKPQQVTEIWTFRRDPNAGPNSWELSAIQQSA